MVPQYSVHADRHRRLFLRDFNSGVCSKSNFTLLSVSSSHFSSKVRDLYLFLCENNKTVVAVRTPNTVTLCTKWPRRNLQIVYGKWDKIQEVSVFSFFLFSVSFMHGRLFRSLTQTVAPLRLMGKR